MIPSVLKKLNCSVPSELKVHDKHWISAMLWLALGARKLTNAAHFFPVANFYTDAVESLNNAHDLATSAAQLFFTVENVYAFTCTESANAIAI